MFLLLWMLLIIVFEYTWSSRGSTVGGDLGACVGAPGSAVVPVSTWTLQRYTLMNETLTASPSVCGGTALLFSAIKAQGILVSPYNVRKALENTAVPIVMDHTNLRKGLHYYEVHGTDCKTPCCGPLFRIPMAIIEPIGVANRPLQIGNGILERKTKGKDRTWILKASGMAPTARPSSLNELNTSQCILKTYHWQRHKPTKVNSQNDRLNLGIWVAYGCDVTEVAGHQHDERVIIHVMHVAKPTARHMITALVVLYMSIMTLPPFENVTSTVLDMTRSYSVQART
ncbi:hypothetical protein VNO77_08616 [Canavalia gladiata]|uniref:Peptidase S8/S53 domain-containing protein n=1 Tax=Canavalia gladiata TaxID=3824 RepID=A0AAN9QWN7_CANGL